MFERERYRLWTSRKGRWETADPVVYLSRSGERHVVPEGFGTDLASTPRALWSVLPPFGKYLLPSVVHDWYTDNPDLMERKEADELFLEMLRAVGVNAPLAWTMYAGVRLGAAVNKLKEKANGN